MISSAQPWNFFSLKKKTSAWPSFFYTFFKYYKCTDNGLTKLQFLLCAKTSRSLYIMLYISFHLILSFSQIFFFMINCYRIYFTLDSYILTRILYRQYICAGKGKQHVHIYPHENEEEKQEWEGILDGR